jgi:hypothetical protein
MRFADPGLKVRLLPAAIINIRWMQVHVRCPRTGIAGIHYVPVDRRLTQPRLLADQIETAKGFDVLYVCEHEAGW